ncbi:MAG TPA: hypothetical protein VHG08_00600 [Longimicrobium sp.]|nr:hypothetical protein [Longimicrobium sp.]
MDASDLYRQLSTAHAEALRVHDSPVYADQLASRVASIIRGLDQAEINEDTQKRIRDALGIAERVLRRDDDGREAARHIHTAIGLLGPRPRKPSPFLDDPEE